MVCKKRHQTDGSVNLQHLHISYCVFMRTGSVGNACECTSTVSFIDALYCQSKCEAEKERSPTGLSPYRSYCTIRKEPRCLNKHQDINSKSRIMHSVSDWVCCVSTLFCVSSRLQMGANMTEHKPYLLVENIFLITNSSLCVTLSVNTWKLWEPSHERH